MLEDAAVQIGDLSLQLLHTLQLLRLRVVLSGCGGGRSLALALVGRGSSLPWLERTAIEAQRRARADKVTAARGWDAG